MAWQILDPSRIQRRERRIEWPVSLRTHMRFRDLLAELVELETHPASLEIETRKEILREEIRALPRFPKRYDPERDLIVPVTTSVQR